MSSQSTSSKPGIVRINPSQLDAVLAQARRARNDTFVLVGPAYDWSWLGKLLDSHQRILQLTRYTANIGRRIAGFTNLKTLMLWDVDLRDDDLIHIASLPVLTSLDLSANRIGDAAAKRLASLSGLVSLTLAGNNIGATGAKHIASLSGLVSLNLASNYIGEIGAKHIASLSGLASLNLAHNEIGEAGAKHIASLSGLTSLDLEGNNIGETGAKRIASLHRLASLNLANNRIGEAGAKHIASLSGLTSLALGFNELGETSARHIASLSMLTSLDLSFNKLGAAGARHIASLSMLTSLNLGGFNELGESGAKHIASLSRLTSLNLEHGKIGEAGAKHIASLPELTSLDLNSNWIGAAGAKDIASLSGLTSLDLSYNQLGEAGARHIASLSALMSLGLNGNEIGDTGVKRIASLSGLASLDLAYNKIGETGAKHISSLSGLASLNLNHNDIGGAGAKHIASMAGLTSLLLGNNNIGDVGAKHIAAALSGLGTLDLDNNNISDAGAKHIAALSGLNSLSLGGNNIGDAGARHLAALSDLRWLWLKGTSINDAGAKHLAALTYLQGLDLEDTNVEQVACFAGLSNIEDLNLAKTRVYDLTPLRPLFERGIRATWDDRYGRRAIRVKDCPLVHPPLEVVRAGNEAVLNYFREVEAQGADRLFEAKMLIVGEGRAGKTTLLRRLYVSDSPMPSEQETTKGIQIHRHIFRLRSGRDFRLNVWDFGGQQIYHATHQFFLTKSSLYVLLDDTAKDHNSVTDEGFRYWLEVIELLSDRSPVLIFQNEKGGRSKAIDEAGIKGRFPNVKDIYRGDLAQPQSVDRLRGAIELFAEQLPHVGAEVPAQWVAIRTAVENESTRRPHMSQQDYFDVYARHLDFDREKALHLSRYLHDIGVCLHFQDDRLLRRTVILQNRWATEAVFRMLDDESVKSRHGEFTIADCERVWDAYEYADMHPELLALLEKFELCYRVPDARDLWLMPQMLAPSKPQVLENWEAPGDLVLVYRYGFMPKGLIARLIVRMHRYVVRRDLAWATGVLFERDGGEVLAQIAPRGNEIVLRARGSGRKELLIVIAHDLDALNASFRGLETGLDKWIPCICKHCATTARPELYEQKRLLKRKEDNRLSIECPASYEEVSVLELLDGLRLEELPAWYRDRTRETAVATIFNTARATPGTKAITLFLASSQELKEDRDDFDLYFQRQNEALLKKGFFLKIVRWEHFLDEMSKTRLQDEYNREVRNADIFVCLFRTKTGKFTEEEFDVAHAAFEQHARPHIFTYFRNAQISTRTANQDDLESLWRFQKKLKGLGHFPTEYENTEGLQLHFRDQLDKLIDGGRLR